MRVDVGVEPNSMLDWDTTLGQQPNVLKQIEANMSEPVRERLEEISNA